MHLSLQEIHSLVLNQDDLGFKGTLPSSPRNLYFLGKEEIKRWF